MSGTSGDGVDASLINSNGIDHFEVIQDKYFEYDSSIYNAIHSLKKKIFFLKNSKKFSKKKKKKKKKKTNLQSKIEKNFNFINSKNNL